MGKAAARGSVRVELARETFQPGETLDGTVYVNLPQSLSSATLKVRAVGRQALGWLVARGKGMTGHHTKIEHLNEEIVLAEGVEISDGDSLYPFSIQLPEELQHNFVYTSRSVEELQAVRASVQFEAEAVLSVAGARGPHMDAKATFRVNPLPTAVPFGREVDVMTEEPIKFMGMFDRGACGVELSIDTDVLDASSTIEARVMLNVKTPLSLKYVILALYEQVTIDRHNPLSPGKRHGTRRVCCRRMDKAAIALANATDGDSTILTMHLPLSPNEISDTDPLSPTMTSFFVDVSYRVAVEVKFPMVPRIKASVPVTVIERLVAPQELEVASVA